MKNNKKIGYIAPIVITVLLIIYLAVYFGVLLALTSGVLKYLLLIIPVSIAGALIFVCVERINEIRSSDEDDLSKY